MEKQRPAHTAVSSTQRKLSYMVGKAVGIDLRSSTEKKMTDDAVKPEVRKESQVLGWASVLRVKVVKARDLAQKNFVTGKSDPYVTVTLGTKVRRVLWSLFDSKPLPQGESVVAAYPFVHVCVCCGRTMLCSPHSARLLDAFVVVCVLFVVRRANPP